MSYPRQIEDLRSVISALPGVEEVEAQHTPLSDFVSADLRLAPFGDLPHAAIRRTNGGLPGESLGQILIRLAPTLESWRTLEFLSWQVRDWSRSGKNIQIRTRGLPPIAGDQIQFGTSLLVVIDVFEAGVDEEPERLLQVIQEFGKAIQFSRALYGLEWSNGEVDRKAEQVAAGDTSKATRA